MNLLWCGCYPPNYLALTKDQQDYEEGFYLVDINYGNNETASLGIGSDSVSYGGVQYETGKGSLDEVVSIFAYYLN